MPIIDFVKRGFDEGTYKLIYGGLFLTNQFWKDLKIKKTREGFKCAVCDKEKPKGTSCIGDTYRRICFSCFNEWIEKSNETLSKIQEEFNYIKEEFRENKEMWERELIVNSLGD